MQIQQKNLSVNIDQEVKGEKEVLRILKMKGVIFDVGLF